MPGLAHASATAHSLDNYRAGAPRAGATL